MIAERLTTRLIPYLIMKDRLLLRWGGPAVVLVISVLVGLMVPRQARIAYLVLGLVFGIAGGLTMLRWPGLGFPLVVVSSLVVPFSLGTGTQTSINASYILVLAMLGLWILEMVARLKKITLVVSRPMLPLILFMISTFISFGFGQLLWFPAHGASIAAQIGGMTIFLLSAGAFLVTAHRLEKPYLKWMVWVFLILGSIYIIGALIPYFPIRRLILRNFQRAVLDSQFWLWFTVLAFSQGLINTKLSKPIRLALMAATLLSLYTTLELKQAWTSGWMPCVLSIAVVLLMVRPKLAIGLGVVFGLLLVVRSQAASEVLMAGDNSYSLLTRLEAWKILFQIIERNPLFGVGPSNYYFYTPFFNILGYNVKFNSHNNYIDILAQTGIAGLALFLWFSAEVGVVGWKIRNLVAEGFDKAFVYGAIGGLAGMLVAAMLGDWVLPFVYNVGMEGFRASVLGWIFLGAIVMYEQRLRSSQQLAEG
jgi:O-antigen ligase